MLTRQALWVPVAKHNPAFVERLHGFLQNNPFTSLNVAAVGLKLEDIRVALEPDARDPNKMITPLMAFPVQVSATACDCVLDHQQKDQQPQLNLGFATAICDSFNTFHVMERLLPALNMHVSINIESHCMRNLREGEKFVVVSTIDKIGKRIAYCKANFLVEPTDPVPTEVIQRERNIKTLAELQKALMNYENTFSVAHVKSIISERKPK
ncbi:hypothetical protein JKF63_05023 [Porcisia hertigi]|uniref:Thioesterase domain-containing protein n=1 Tax=Porcisia hertigi TaxID=2761500 RepID=A0A836LI68_9TRYP|nr:hypothetical protein JKF63_05023 [Porcisia hertigi]